MSRIWETTGAEAGSSAFPANSASGDFADICWWWGRHRNYQASLDQIHGADSHVVPLACTTQSENTSWWPNVHVQRQRDGCGHEERKTEYQGRMIKVDPIRTRPIYGVKLSHTSHFVSYKETDYVYFLHLRRLTTQALLPVAIITVIKIRWVLNYFMIRGVGT